MVWISLMQTAERMVSACFLTIRLFFVLQRQPGSAGFAYACMSHPVCPVVRQEQKRQDTRGCFKVRTFLLRGRA